MDVEIQGPNGGSNKAVAPLTANYGPSSLLIGEFPKANDKDQHEAFAMRKAITVTVPKKFQKIAENLLSFNDKNIHPYTIGDPPPQRKKNSPSLPVRKYPQLAGATELNPPQYAKEQT